MEANMRPLLSLFPDAPSGASMFSRYVAFHYISCSRSIAATKLMLFGNYQSRAIDTFGSSLSKVAQVMPEQAFPVEWLLDRATFFGFYSSVLAPERKYAWRLNQMASQARLVNKFVTGQAGRYLTKQYLHFCPLCVNEDEHVYGFAHWRLVHQVPGVAHCPAHWILLSGACAHCSEPVASETQWYPPSRQCPHCSSSVFQKAPIYFSRAYKRFIELCNAVFDGREMNLSPVDRIGLYGRFCSTAGSSSVTDKELDKFIAVVLSGWDLPDLEKLETLLSAKMDRLFVREAITGQDHVVNPVGHLAIMAALEVKNSPKRRTRADELTATTQPFSARCLAILAAYRIDPEQLFVSLKETAIEHGLPEQTGIMLVEGNTHSPIISKLKICGARLGRFAKALDELKLSEFCSFADIRLGVKIEIRRDEHRMEIRRLLDHEKLSRKALKERLPKTFAWCTVNDKDWLREQCPRESVGEKRMRHRHAIESLMAEGCRTQRAIHEKNFTAYHWCITNDRVWLDEKLPSVHRYKGLSTQDMQKLCRAIITAALSSGITKRSDLPGRARGWCTEHDIDWLDTMIPRRDRRSEHI